MHLKSGHPECLEQKATGNNYFVPYMYKYPSSSWGTIETITMATKHFSEFMSALNSDKTECF